RPDRGEVPETRTAARKRPSVGLGWRRGRRGLVLGGALPLAELVHAAAGVHQLLLAGVEGVRSRGDFDLDQGVFLAVFPLDGLFAGQRRAGEEDEVRSDVLENDFVVLGMDVGSHGSVRDKKRGKDPYSSQIP